MLGVTINTFHTFENFGLGWLGVKISPAELQTHYIEIDGRDGPLDATEALSGRPVYKQRTLTLEFDALGTFEEYMQRCSEIDFYTNGRRCEIFLDIDPQYYWIGRGTWQHSKTADGKESHIYTAIIEPYKYRKFLTQKTVVIASEKTVAINNLQAPSYPLFTTESEGMTVLFGTAAYSIMPGTDIPIYDITLLQGINNLTFSGSGTVKIKYQEGVL